MPRLHLQPQGFCRIIAAVCIAIGIVTLLSWAADFRGLSSLHNRFGPMHPASAAGFVLGGIALWLRLEQKPSWHQLWTARVCALIIAVMAGGRIGRSWFWGSGPESLLSVDILRGLPMPSLWAFLLLALGLLLLDVEWRWFRPSEYLAILAGSIALLAVIAFCYNVFSIQRLQPSSRAAPHSLLCFTGLALGILFARSKRGLMSVFTSGYLGGLLARRLLPVAVILPALLGWLTVEAMRAGGLDAIRAVAISACLSSIAFAVLVIWHARHLNRIDAGRESAIAALSKSESILALSQRIVHLGSWELNLASRELTWSAEAFRIFGFDPATTVASEELFFRRVHGDDREQVHTALAEAETGGHYDCEHRVMLPGGTCRIVHGKGETIADASRTLRLIGTIQDVTEQRVLEEQLRQSQRMEAVGRLAGGVAHDFNNLLTVILGYCSLALDDRRREDVVLRLEEIRNAGESAAALTQQLLAFCRRQVLEPRILSLADTVGEMDRMIRRTLGEDIEIRTYIAPALGTVRVDRSQIQQVILNLVVNARDAMPDGGKLTIELKNEYLDEHYSQLDDLPTGNFVMMAVSDDGIGMTPEVRQRIFDPFFTTKEAGKGTGLGLATVYGIVRQSGGYIWCYSEKGAGTTFKIFFPRIDGEPEVQRIAQPGSTRGTETILLVEDDQKVRMLAQEVLSLSGYQVLAAQDVDEAIDECRRCYGPIHLLISDIVLPKCSGPQILDRITTLRPHLPALFMSGYSEKAIDQYGVRGHRVSFLIKPFTPGTLLAKVREVLDSPEEDELPTTAS